MKLLFLIASISLVSTIFCGCVTSPQKQYDMKIRDEWPEHVKDFHRLWDQWLNMNRYDFFEYFEKMNKNEFEKLVKQLYALYEYNPKHHANQVYEMHENVKQLVKYNNNMIPPLYPFVHILNKVEKEYSFKDRLIINQPIIAYFKIINIEKVPFLIRERPYPDDYDNQIRIQFKVLDVYKGNLKKDQIDTFRYLERWNYKGNPFISGNNYIIFLTYREEAHEWIDPTMPAGPYKLHLDIWRDQEDGVFEEKFGYVDDPSNFFGYGEKIPIDSFKVRINKDILKWK